MKYPKKNMFAFSSCTAKSADDVVKELRTDAARGLAAGEAEKRREKYGANSISEKRLYWWHVLWRQFKSPFIYLLLAAAVLAAVLAEYVNAAIILLFLLINATLGFYQEYKSERALKLLKQFIASFAKIIRGGRETAVHAEEIVPGDIVVLETGDKIPADVRFITAYNLAVDETVLTGESVPVKKTENVLKREAGAYFEAANIGFAGTTVASGRARGVVIATGDHASIGRIARLEAGTKRISNFEKEISQFSKFILKLVLVTLAFVFAANIFIKGAGADYITLLIFSIALAVSVIPEALPVVTTFSLSRGAMRLARQKVVVKRLSAIEDLGTMEVLCTDKTGTLTENELTISGISPGSSPRTIFYANLAASALRRKRFEPFDIALWKNSSADEKKEIDRCERLAEEPFDPEKRYNTVLVAKDGRAELIVRGAPEGVLDISGIPSAERKKIDRWLAGQGARGKRTLAVAVKTVAPDRRQRLTENLSEETDGFTLAGLISFSDPVKKSAFAAVKQATELGVRIVILTGDSKEVAGAVAAEIGLLNNPGEVMTAGELEALPPEEQAKAAEKYRVFARVAPEQKYRLIQLYQKKYRVGFLGEGINDAPALKIAGVSLVVQSAADIAREAADIVLLKKNLKVVLDGIRQGREVFLNTSKYIKTTLTSNFGNFYAVAIASLLVDFLPMLPIQILLLNLMSDFPMIAISTDRVDPAELNRPQRHSVKDIVIISSILGIVSTVFDFIFFGIFYRISPEALQTYWFIGSVLTELILIFSLRSKRFCLRAPGPSLSLLLLAGTTFLLAIVLPFIRLGRELFSFITPSAYYLILVLSVVAVYFISTETIKLLYYRKFGHTAK